MIGTPTHLARHLASLHVTWQGWRGGVVPRGWGERLAEDNVMSLAPVIAAAACAAEVFSVYAGDHPLAGRRCHGLSLWDPRADWLADEDGPTVAYLPSKLWLIGLGNLGQAYSWLLAALPYVTYPLPIVRQLQRYTVNIYAREFEALQSQGAIQTLHERYNVLDARWMETHYHRQTGLVLPTSSGGAAVFFD